MKTEFWWVNTLRRQTRRSEDNETGCFNVSDSQSSGWASKIGFFCGIVESSGFTVRSSSVS
jgi:hypothetical protein